MRARSDGSRGMLQRLVNARPEILQDALVESGLPVDHPIRWTSPLFSEDFRMYRDKAFLDRLNVQLQHRPLRDFWPARGPRWGGLGRCGSQVLLVEAATSMEEFDTACQASSGASFSLIDRALAETRDFLGATADRDWTANYYRFANRLAHLYLLRQLNGIDAKLVLVHFHDTNALEPTGSWLDTIASHLGLPYPSNWIQTHVKEVFIDAAPLGDVEWPPAEPLPKRSAAGKPAQAYNTPLGETADVPRIVGPTQPVRPAVDPNTKASVPTMWRGTPDVTFDGIADAIILDVKTTGHGAQARATILVLIGLDMSDVFPEDGHKQGKQPMKFYRLDPERPAPPPTQSSSHTNAELDDDEEEDPDRIYSFSEIAARVRKFVGDRPIIAYNASVATTILDRELTLAGVESIRGNPRICIKARFERDSHHKLSSSLEAIGRTVGKGGITIGNYNADSKDAETIVRVALLFWFKDNRYSERKDRMVSDSAFVGFLNVANVLGFVGAMLPAILFYGGALVLLLWIMSLLLPGWGFMLFLIFFGGACVLMWWTADRIDELEKDESDEFGGK